MSPKNTELIIRERQKHCVCKMCGSKLEVRMIIYNQYGGQGLDLYCPKCERVEFGIEPEIYELAAEFVDKLEFENHNFISGY